MDERALRFCRVIRLREASGKADLVDFIATRLLHPLNLSLKLSSEKFSCHGVAQAGRRKRRPPPDHLA